jgi:hypothetical protein
MIGMTTGRPQFKAVDHPAESVDARLFACDRSGWRHERKDGIPEEFVLLGSHDD